MPAANKAWEVGCVRGTDQFSAEEVQTHQLRVSRAADLRDLSQQYAFYTPALMYLHVRLMGRDPFHNFISEYRHSVVPITLTFDKPVFTGLNNEWNHRLLGMELEHFKHYRSWLGTLAFADRDRKLVSRVRYREILLADPLALAKLVTIPNEVPLVPITAVCLDSNQGCWTIDPSPKPLLVPPKARFIVGKFRDTQALSQAILDGSDNPLGDMESQFTLDGMSVAEQELRERVRKAREGQS